jgi:putative cell wall-binding protein
MLLNPVDALDQRVAAELMRLGTTEVMLMGGVAALSPAVEAALADAGMMVTRVEGSNRYATAGATAAAVAARTGPPSSVFLASGEDFADAVAVAGLAAFTGQPILLTRQADLPSETATSLAGLGEPSVTVVGGPAAVSADQPADLRLEGGNRYGTSAAVVDHARNAGLRINRPWIATGESFADALVSGPAAAAAGQILVLVDGDDLSGSTDTNALIAMLSGQVDGLTVVSTAGAVADAATETLRAAVQGPVQPEP